MPENLSKNWALIASFGFILITLQVLKTDQCLSSSNLSPRMFREGGANPPPPILAPHRNLGFKLCNPKYCKLLAPGHIALEIK